MSSFPSTHWQYWSLAGPCTGELPPGSCSWPFCFCWWQTAHNRHWRACSNSSTHSHHVKICKGHCIHVLQQNLNLEIDVGVGSVEQQRQPTRQGFALSRSEIMAITTHPKIGPKLPVRKSKSGKEGTLRCRITRFTEIFWCIENPKNYRKGHENEKRVTVDRTCFSICVNWKVNVE